MPISKHVTTHLGAIQADAHVHDDGTHSLSFASYPHGSSGARYSSQGFHFTREDFVALHKLIGKALRRSAPKDAPQPEPPPVT